MTSIKDITPGTWNLDPTHSEIGFTVRHAMVSKVRGKFGEFAATAVAAQPVENSTVDVTVQMASFTTGNEDRDNHIKSGDFFEVETYPTMTFKATKITDDEITGDLTLKGITKSVTFDYEFNGEAKDPWGGTRAGFEATGEINRGDFGITFNAPLEGGGVLLSEKVKINLDLEFVLASE